MSRRVGTLRLSLLLILLCRSAAALSGTNCSLTVSGAVGANLSVLSSCVTTSVWVQPNIILLSGTPMPSGLGISKASNTAGIPQTATWRVSGSPTIAGTGSGVYQFSDPNAGTITMTVNFSIISAVLPAITLSAGTVGRPYSATVSASGGTASGYSFVVSAGSLPGGLAMSSGGVISGSPSATGSFPFTIQATDSGANTGVLATSITVNPAVSMTGTASMQRTVSQSFNATYSAIGGTGQLVYTLASGSMPPGASLNAGSGAVSGIATSAAAGSFQIQATDANGSSATTTVSFTVVAAPVLFLSTPGAIVATPYSQAIQFSGAISTATLASGTIPPGLSLSPGTAIAGTPTTSGTYNFTLTATDSNGVTAIFSASILVSSSVSITTVVFPNATLSSPYSASTAANGGSGTGFSFALVSGSLPQGLSLALNGSITGTPGTAGLSSFTILATDNIGNTGSRALSIQVDAALAINTASYPTALIASPYSASTIAAGGSGSSYSFSISAGTLPAGLTLASSGLISGTPTVAGLSNFTITVTDSLSNSGSRALSMQVNSLPSIGNLSFPAAVPGSPYSASTTATGGSGSGYSFAISAGNLPAGLTLAASGLISGTPTVSGLFNFTITVTDSLSNSGSRALSLQVNSLPSISNLSFPAAVPGSPYSASTNATGGSGSGYSFAISAGNLPAGLTLAASGLISGTPTVGGLFNFTITVTDSLSNSGSRTLSLQVNSLPSISNLSFPAALLGSPYSALTTALGGSGSGYSFAFTVGTLPAGLTLAASGLISGTPTVGGLFNFTITVTDSLNNSGSRPFSIQVAAPLVILSNTALPPGTVGIPITMRFTASGGLGALNWSANGPMISGLSLNNGILSGIPTLAGTNNFLLTVTDSLGATTSAQVTQSIREVPSILTHALVGPFSRAGAIRIPIEATGGVLPYLWKVTTGKLPLGLFLNPVNGLLYGAFSETGSTEFTVTLTDSVGASVSQRFLLVVSEGPVFFSPAALPSATLNSPYQFEIDVRSILPITDLQPGSGQASLPPGLTLLIQTLQGIPLETGSYLFNLAARDQQGSSASQTFMLTVNPALRFSDATILPTIHRAAALSWSPSMLGGSLPFLYQVLGGALPPGIQLNAATGKLTGQATQSGRFGFTLGVVDVNSSRTSRLFDAEVIDSLVIRQGTIPAVLSPGKSYRWPILVEGGTAPYTFSFPNGTPPTGMKMNGSNLEWQPVKTGIVTVELRATDALGSSAATQIMFTVSDGIIANPSLLQFKVLRGGPASKRQLLKLSAIPINTLIRISSNAGWLRFSSITSRSPGAVEVWVDPGLMPKGQANAELILIAGETTKVPVSVEVLDKSQGNFTVSSVRNSSGTFLIWLQAAADKVKFALAIEGAAASDYRLSTKSGDLDAFEPQLILLEPKSAGVASLSPLDVVVHNLSSNEIHRVPLSVAQREPIEFSSRRIQLQAEEGAQESNSESIQWSRLPSGTAWRIASASSWLLVDPPVLQLISKQSIRLRAKSRGLPAGIHQTQLEFIDPAGDVRGSLAVELDVQQESLPVQVSSRSLSFNRNELKRSIRLRNLGNENQSFVALASSSLVQAKPEQGSIPANSEILLDLTISESAFQSWTRHQLAIEFSDGRMEILELDLGLLPAAGICPSSAPVLSFLNPPAAYEWTVGIPQRVEIVVKNPCGAIQQGSALAINSERQGIVSLWPTEDGTWIGSWTPQFASLNSSIQAIWVDTAIQQSVSRTITGRVGPNPDLGEMQTPHP